MRSATRRALSTVAGVAVALVVLELVTRAWFGEFRDGHRVVIRQWAEGTSTVHYTVDPALHGQVRLTSIAAIEGAPTILVIGDSFVNARQVADDATFGAILARRSHDAGTPLNVVQYSVPGGAAPEYAAEAERLIARWNPATVVVVVPTNDLTEEPITRTPHWRLRLGPRDGEVGVVAAPPPDETRELVPRLLDALRPLSALAQLLRLRRAHATGTPWQPEHVDPAEVAHVPAATVTLLKRAFGDRLAIVHLPEISMRTDRVVSPEERRLEQACRDAGVPYASAYDDFMSLRDRGILARGFHNTMPGEGHLNETGHRAFAEVVWRLLADTRARPSATAAPTRSHE